MLRSIAICLGFGSSISRAKLFTGESIIKFPFSDGHSLFDNILVTNNGKRLNELYNTGRKQNEDIIRYCTGVFGDVYVDGFSPNAENDSTYKMYTPSVYKDNKSMIYLKNPKSLMHHSLSMPDKILQVDTVTANILNKIGWDFENPSDQFKITGENIPETGITSAYSTHAFHIEGEGHTNIIEPKWNFWLPSASGNDILVKSSMGNLVFDIDAIANPDDYMINVNGDIYGKIEFTGKINGNDIRLLYNVTFELKPSISKVEFIRQGNAGFDTYNVSCKVDYKGADFLFVSLEEEYGATLRSQFVREPYLAHFICKDITSPYYAWIDITVENGYGSEVYTIELPPYNNQMIQGVSTNILHDRKCNDNVSDIKVFNINGQYLQTVYNISDIKSLKSGLYILELYQNDRLVKTSKLLK